MKITANYTFFLPSILIACSSICFADSASDRITVTATVIPACSVSYETKQVNLDQGLEFDLDWTCTNGANPSFSVTDENYGDTLDLYSQNVSRQLESGRFITSIEGADTLATVNLTLEF